ncbi:hypothetical protein CPB83DRAFT_777637, partial [Crepidotus variabilis]
MATRELRLNAPTPFSGDRSKIKTFLQSCDLYLLVNNTAYDSDDKKIAFVLSNLSGGEAEVWKQQFIVKAEADAKTVRDGMTAAQITANPPPAILLGTYDNFKKNFKEAFDEIDSVNDALYDIRTLKQ